MPGSTFYELFSKQVLMADAENIGSSYHMQSVEVKFSTLDYRQIEKHLCDSTKSKVDGK